MSTFDEERAIGLRRAVSADALLPRQLFTIILPQRGPGNFTCQSSRDIIPITGIGPYYSD